MAKADNTDDQFLRNDQAPDPTNATDITQSPAPVDASSSPTSSDGGFDPNVNNPNTTWSPGADRPDQNYPGWSWDSNMGRYVQSSSSAPTAPTGSTSGGDTTPAT